MTQPSPYEPPPAGRPEHGQPQYGQPPYGPPAPPYPQQDPYQPPQPSSRPAGTNGFAIASLIFGILGGLLFSITFGIVALVQVRRSGQRGKGLAVAGLVLSGAWIVLLAVLLAVVLATSPDRDSSGQLTSGGSIQVEDLEVGDCVNGVRENKEFRRLPAVPCAEPHEAEVFAVFQISGSSWPGQAAVQEQAEGCVDRLEGYAPAAVDDEKLEVFYLHPTEQSWRQGDREVTCLVVDLARRTGSVKG